MSTLLISSESSLPPNVHGKTRGYLEIEVTRINFTTLGSIATNTPANDRYIARTPIGSQGATAKVIWWGESKASASSIRIVRAAKGATLNNHYQNSCLQQQTQLKCSKVRYAIQTCLHLFLEYLQTCEPLEISISTAASNLPLGSAQVRLPPVFLRKFAANYAVACNFEHKSKIYALYTGLQNGNKTSKCGEFQLRFKMLFAPSAKKLLHEQLEQEMTFEANGKHKSDANAVKQLTDNSASRKSSKTDEIVEAMKKIDAKLVAYLAGEDMKPKEEALALERLQCTSPISQLVGEMVQERFREQQLKIYQRVNTLKMHLEALTLQPAGTKFMELLEEDIKPILTVECQLSNELIRDIARYDMFHMMQFESGQFQSLTQCTRFAQDAQREIHLQPVADDVADDESSMHAAAENAAEAKLNFGQLSFIVWWRQPGTCLNEMLGMAVFDLEELYQASLLEQCKCLAIKRRDVHLANLYFKISFQLRRNSNGELKLLKDLKANSSLAKQCAGGEQHAADKQLPADAKEAKNLENSAAARAGDKPNAKAADMKKAANNNNNPQLETTDFAAAETTKVRLLKGLIIANETRQVAETNTSENYLLCRRFWHKEIVVTALQRVSAATAQFKYQEQFSIINDELFLQRVEKQFLQLELWRRSATDNNGNAMEPFGVVRLPLHQYFIAYRDAAITNHLCKGKLPVISIDAWVPIVNYASGATVGELKCLLAIGSEEQIENLKATRGLPQPALALGNSEFGNKLTELFATTPLQHPATIAEQLKTKLAQVMTGCAGAGKLQSTISSDAASGSNTKLKNTSDLFDMLRMDMSSLMTPPASAAAIVKPAVDGILPSQSLQKPLQQANTKSSFKFILDIQRATNLPLNPAVKSSKKGSKRNAANMAAKQNRFPPNEPPSVYVTFQADEGNGKMFKSHEGLVYATNIVEKSTQPVWEQRFRTAATVDYLSNTQKCFILKVWKKAVTDLAQCRLQPTPMEDAIIGFAAIDLTVFLRGMHIGGWFNIVDFNGRINGQLELKCQPAEDVQQLTKLACPYINNSAVASTTNSNMPSPGMDNFIDQFETSLELSHHLGQAIKRKFSELEQISHRLRTRLVDVTGEQFAANFDPNTLDNLAALSSDAQFDDEFEHDLKTPPPEEENELTNKIISTGAVEEQHECENMSSSTQVLPLQHDAPQ